MKNTIIRNGSFGTADTVMKRGALRRVMAVLLVFSLAALTAALSPAEKVYAAAVSDLSVVSVKADTLWGRTGAGDEYEICGTCVKNSSYRCYDSKRASDGSLWYKVKDEKGSYFWLDSRYAENYNAPGSIIYSNNSYFSRQVVPKKELTIYAEARADSGAAAVVGTDCSLCVIGDGVGSDNRSWFKVVYGNRTGWISRADVNIYNSCDPVPERVFSPGNIPVIYLSPSNQAGNPYAAGGTNEYVQCQAVAVELKKILEIRYDCVVYIADQKLALSASGRPSEAASLGADIYLAIHTNASDSGASYGPQAYFYPGGTQSRLLGENLVNAMKSVSPFGNTVTNLINGMNYLSGYGYGEVRSPGALGMVAMLFEAEYHDNADSANWIIANTAKIASALADGLNRTFAFPAAGSSAAAESTAADAVPGTDAQTAATTAATAPVAQDGKDTEEKVPETTTTVSVPEPVKAVNGADLAGLDEIGFFEALAPICRRDMAENGVLASVTLAQAALESNYGKNELTLNANNIFGMKQNISGNTWDTVWKGQLYQKVSDEDQNSVTQFRAYESVNASICDHSRYLIGVPLDDGLRYAGIQGERDYKKAANIIASGGYVTDSMYADSLIYVIEKYGLTKYDTESYAATTATAAPATTTVEKDIQITSIQIEDAPETMIIGKSAVIGLITDPYGATESPAWSSSNTAIARVDASGKVTAIGAGKVRITVHAALCSAFCDITVKPDIKPEMLGPGINITEPYGIRFATRIEKNTAWESVDAVGMGTLIIPKDQLGDAQLTINNDKALNVPSTKKYSESDTEFVFTGKLSGITADSFDQKILARSYVIYRNIDGSESAVYSDICEKSFRDVARESLKVYQALPEGTPDREDMIEKLEALIAG